MDNVAVSTPKFKVGDRVRCIIGSTVSPISTYVNRTYTVEGVHNSFVLLKSQQGWWCANRRFQLVPSKPFVKSEWM